MVNSTIARIGSSQLRSVFPLDIVHFHFRELLLYDSFHFCGVFWGLVRYYWVGKGVVIRRNPLIYV